MENVVKTDTGGDSSAPSGAKPATTPTATVDDADSQPTAAPDPATTRQPSPPDAPVADAADDARETDDDNPGGRKRSRLNMAVPDETIARYTVARGFLIAEWLGALLIVASFTLLYVLYAQGHDPWIALGIALAIGLLGTATFWRSRRIYRGLDFPYAPKWEAVANVTAASGAIFWLLFATLVILTYSGIPVLPTNP